MRRRLAGLALMLWWASPVAAAPHIRVYTTVPSHVYMRPHSGGSYQLMDGVAGDTPLMVEVAAGQTYDFKAVSVDHVSFFEQSGGEITNIMAGGRAEISQSTEVDPIRVTILAVGLMAVVGWGVGSRHRPTPAPRLVTPLPTPRSRTSKVPGAAPDTSRMPPEGGGSTMPAGSQQNTDARQSMPQPGDTIAGYHVERLIASGGMGSVYEVIDSKQRRFALKAPRLKVLEDEVSRARFQREIQIGQQLHHPNIVAIAGYHLGDVESPAFIVFELIEGPTLTDVLRADAPMDVRRAVGLVAPILEALEYGHRQGVLHRDVKPSNILLQGGTTPKLTDYGVARLADATSLTSTQASIGTPIYMAPEQLKARDVDVRADVYSAGVILFEAVTGRRPFEAEDIMTIIAQKVVHDPPLASSVRPDLPDALDTVLQRAMAREVDQRYPSAQAFLDALRAL